MTNECQESLNPLKKRLLVGLAVLSNRNGDGIYDSLFSLHKLTKVPLSKINQLLNELHEDGVIQLHSKKLVLEEAA